MSAENVESTVKPNWLNNNPYKAVKTMTIWQRLDRVMLLLVILLLAGVGVAFWIAVSCSGAFLRTEQLSQARYRICYDIIRMAEFLHNGSAQPGNELESRHRQEVEKELTETFEKIQSDFHQFPSLLHSVANVREFGLGTETGTFGEFRSHVLAIADPANALTYYNSNYPALIRQRERLFNELGLEVDQVNQAEDSRALTIAIIGGTCLLLIALASLFVRRFQSTAIAEPLNRVVATLERMRQGDFTQRLTLAQQDEFGAIGEGLNRLADDLCELVGQVQRSGIQVTTTATQISATAKEQQGTAHEIAATTTQIGATSKQISATSRELVHTMNEVTQVAEQTARLAGSGQAGLAQMEATMRQIMDASASITARLGVLSEKTANINSVVTTITKVADQTNLLSLNAAIEAEKAGEYGLGFAVVAMEIRRLADQTAVATFDIEKMVKEMQSAAAAGVMGMDKFAEQVRKGVEEVRNVGTQLAQIIQQVQTLTPRFQTVNEGMHAQAGGAQQISDTLVQLSEAAQQTAESLVQSNLAIDQLNAAARTLQTSVARFKLVPNDNKILTEPNGAARDLGHRGQIGRSPIPPRASL